MLDDYAITYQNDFAQNFQKWAIDWSDRALSMKNPRMAASIRSSYYTNVSTEADCKDLLKDWVNTRFKALHDVLGGEGSYDWPREPLPEPEPEPPGPGPEPPVVDGDISVARMDKRVQYYTQDS